MTHHKSCKKSSHHTTRDADNHQNGILFGEREGKKCRTGTKYEDPVKKGADKIGSGYIDKYLKQTALYDDCDGEEPDTAVGRDEVSDLEYELYYTE